MKCIKILNPIILFINFAICYAADPNISPSLSSVNKPQPLPQTPEERQAYFKTVKTELEQKEQEELKMRREKLNAKLTELEGSEQRANRYIICDHALAALTGTLLWINRNESYFLPATVVAGVIWFFSSAALNIHQENIDQTKKEVERELSLLSQGFLPGTTKNFSDPSKKI